ncbi:MAG: hypothetical protein AB2A00_42435 [Myxococcota bacterium]
MRLVTVLVASLVSSSVAQAQETPPSTETAAPAAQPPASAPPATTGTTRTDECVQPPPTTPPPEPFTLQDNLVTAGAATVDASAGVFMHTVPAFVLVPLLAIVVDSAVARQSFISLEANPIRLPNGGTLETGRMVVETLPALAVVGTLFALYAAVTPLVDAFILLSIRALDQRRIPPWRHVLAMLAAAYLSLPVTFVGTLGVVALVSILTQPDLPDFVPARHEVRAGLEFVAFAATVEIILVVVRPVGLALFERAGGVMARENAPANGHAATRHGHS